MGAVPCPHCHTSVAFVAELAGQQVGCPNCGRQFRMTDADPAVTPIAQAVSPRPVEPAPDTSRPYRPRCRVREYVWLRGVQWSLMIASGLCILGFFAGETVLITTTLQAANAAPATDAQGSALEDPFVKWPLLAAGHIAVQVLLIGGCLWPALIFAATAQLLALMMDVQANTQEAAHYLRYLDR